jgi:hypothetical protein
MKKFFAALWLVAMLPTTTFAQMDDDMYFVPTKKARVQVMEQSFEQEKPSQQQSATAYYSGSNRNVDEYNRMGGYEEPEATGNNDAQQGDFQLTQRMTRFDDYTPTEAYWNGYSQGFNDSRDTYLGWHSPWFVASYYPWYDSWYYPGRYGWYSSWYDPWYYDRWYGYSGWHIGWGWGGWHVGWHSGWNSWAWHRPYYHHRPYYDRWGGRWGREWSRDVARYNRNYRPVAGSRNHGDVLRRGPETAATRNGRTTRTHNGTYGNVGSDRNNSNWTGHNNGTRSNTSTSSSGMRRRNMSADNSSASSRNYGNTTPSTRSNSNTSSSTSRGSYGSGGSIGSSGSFGGGATRSSGGGGGGGVRRGHR